MQTNENTSTVETTIVPSHAANAPQSAKPEAAPVQPVPSIETVAAITDASAANLSKLKTALRAKRTAKPETTNTKAAAKRVNAKSVKTPSVAAKPVKPDQAARDAKREAAINDRREARHVASAAVAAFYSGSSKPFKAAADTFAPINPANAKSATARQAGLMLALITYGAGNMRSNGTFTRGAFRVPARLVNANAKPGDMLLAQPESGCLGNMLGRAADYRSGPTSGVGQAAAIYQLRVNVALAEIQAAFGDKPAASARKLLASFDAKAA